MKSTVKYEGKAWPIAITWGALEDVAREFPYPNRWGTMLGIAEGGYDGEKLDARFAMCLANTALRYGGEVTGEDVLEQGGMPAVTAVALEAYLLAVFEHPDEDREPSKKK